MSSHKPKGVPVSELFDNLVVEYRSGGPPHSILFQTALRVCAEDSKRVQHGEPPSSLRALAERAHSLIKDAYPTAIPASLAGSPGMRAPGEGVPVRFAGRAPSPPPSGGEPTRQPAAPPVPAPGAPRPTQASGTAAPHVSAARPAVSTATPAPPHTGPFEEAAGLAPSRQPASAGLEDAPFPLPPAKPPAREPQRPAVTFEELLPADETPEIPEGLPEEGHGLRVVGRVALVALAFLAAAVAVVILWPGIARRQPVAPRIVESFPAPTPTVAAGDLAAALRASVPAEPTTVAAPRAAPTAPPPTEAPARAATPSPHPPAQEEAEAGVETMRSPDWAGRRPVYVVHFSSYKSRENANADAARLARELGRPAHAVTVDLGERGIWYRVVVGDFATAAEARAFRAEMASRKPGEVSSVFRLAAP